MLTDSPRYILENIIIDWKSFILGILFNQNIPMDFCIHVSSSILETFLLS